jgi:hypothetical protein
MSLMSRFSLAMALSVAAEPVLAETAEETAFRERFDACWKTNDNQCVYDLLVEGAEKHGAVASCVNPQETERCDEDAFILAVFGVAATIDKSPEERREVAEHVIGLTPASEPDNPRKGGGQFIAMLARYEACEKLGDAGCIDDSSQRVRAFVDLAGLDVALSAAREIDRGYTKPDEMPAFEALVETIVGQE